MNSTLVGLTPVNSLKGTIVTLQCPHCDHIIEVPANGGTQESMDALAAWRLASHVSTVHGSAPPDDELGIR